MRVVKDKDGGIVRRVLLLDDAGAPVVPVVRYLGHLMDAGYSPHTVCAYGYDLRYLFEFLSVEGVGWQAFSPSTALAFLGHLRRRPTRRPAQRLGLAVATGAGRRLGPAQGARGGGGRRRGCSGCGRRRRASMSGRSPPGSTPSRRARCASRSTLRWLE